MTPWIIRRLRTRGRNKAGSFNPEAPMKIHFAVGLFIGVAINLAFQLTDDRFAQLDLSELCFCAFLAGLAALLPRAIVRNTARLVAVRQDR